MTKACASSGDVAAHPGLDVAVRGVGGDDPEALVVELGDGEVGLERAALVEPLRVGDDARRAVDVVGRDVVEEPPGVAPLHEELRHERHVHEDHALARRLVLGLPVREPVLPAPREAARPSARRRAARTSRRPPSRSRPGSRRRARPADRGSPTSSRRARSASSASGSGTGRPCRATRPCACGGTRGSPGRCAGGRC